MIARGLVVILAVVAGSLGFIGSAHADTDGIQISRDGVTWQRGLSTPLFDPSVRWVPGDERTAQFFVRNGSRTDAELFLRVASGADSTLIKSGDLTVWVTRPGQPTRLSGTYHSLVNVPSGESQRVQVAARLSPESGNTSKGVRTDLRFWVKLSEGNADRDGAGNPTTNGSGDGDTHGPRGTKGGRPSMGGNGPAVGPDTQGAQSGLLSGILPNTGTAVSLELLLVVGALFGAGFALVRRSRKARDE